MRDALNGIVMLVCVLVALAVMLDGPPSPLRVAVLSLAAVIFVRELLDALGEK